MKRSLVVAAFVLATPVALAMAQTRALPDRLGDAARVSLQRLIDSATAVGIPSGPLYDKASEGVLKGADDERIIHAVQSLATALGEARTALAPSTDPSELGAAASALGVGVSVADLRRLAHPVGAPPSAATLATALVTLVDLVTKHVPVALATTSIQNLIDRRATDQQFTSLRADVEKDILAGRAPDASVIARVRARLDVPPP